MNSINVSYVDNIFLFAILATYLLSTQASLLTINFPSVIFSHRSWPSAASPRVDILVLAPVTSLDHLPPLSQPREPIKVECCQKLTNERAG